MQQASIGSAMPTCSMTRSARTTSCSALLPPSSTRDHVLILADGQ
jgi:hypothetical protein